MHMYKSNYLHMSLISVCDSCKYFIYPSHVFGHNLDGKKTHMKSFKLTHAILKYI